MVGGNWHAMSDKAERVAMRLWGLTYAPQDYLEKAAAILREEYPDEPTLDQLANLRSEPKLGGTV